MGQNVIEKFVSLCVYNSYRTQKHAVACNVEITAAVQNRLRSLIKSGPA